MFRSYVDQTLGYFDRPRIGLPDGPIDDPTSPRHLLRLWVTL